MKISETLKANKKAAVIVILGLICVLLLVISEFIPEKEKEKTAEHTNTTEYDYAQEVEQKLTAMITQIKGAGNAKVMVTLESTEESVYAKNQNIDKETTESEYILIKTGSVEGGMLLKIISPQIRGVAVVCEGGSSAGVRQEITDMITSVLDISSNRVSVLKMK